jgi:membrane-bound lytic murein transglycosylase MltF
MNISLFFPFSTHFSTNRDIRLKSLFLLLTAFLCLSANAKESNNANPQRYLSYQQALNAGKIRMAVPYDPTIYLSSKNKSTGLSVPIAQYFGKWLSNKYQRPISVELVPMPEGKLIDPLDSGEADIAMGYLGGYSRKLKSDKYISLQHAEHQKQVLVSSSHARPINSAEDLSGKVVCLGRQTRSAALKQLNAELAHKGLPPVIIYQDRLALDDEEMLQMVNDGLIEYVLAVKWRTELWKPYIPDARINPNIEFDIKGNIGWAIRSADKTLQSDILDFSSSAFNDEALIQFGKNDFSSRKNALKDPKAKEAWSRFIAMRPIFEKYGQQYGLNPLFLASFGFQETMLNQSLISPTGAIGVMQLMTATGEAMNVGDIHNLDPNIHAGAKYLSQLATQYYKKEDFNKNNLALFAIASYNMGPANINKARKEAQIRGFDPNQWFLNVEIVAAELFGIEPLDYVRNVYKYYLTYQLSLNPKVDISEDQLDHLDK